MTRQDLAYIIKTVKKQMGWTYIEMAEKTGIDMGTLSRYSRKITFPRNPECVVERIMKAVKQSKQEARQHGGYCN